MARPRAKNTDSQAKNSSLVESRPGDQDHQRKRRAPAEARAAGAGWPPRSGVEWSLDPLRARVEDLERGVQALIAASVLRRLRSGSSTHTNLEKW